MIRIRTAIVAFALTVAMATTATAWEGELAGSVQPIADVVEKAEKNDFVVVEGRVTDVQIGDGSVVIARFEDDTGSLYLVIPNHLQRHFAGGTPAGGAGPSGASPEVGAHARVAGKWNQKPMGEGWGIHVQRAEPIED
jgi:hypothetical protein